MLRNPPTRRRRGASMVEAAIVLPIAFMLVIGLIVGALGIFRYQEVAFLAREGARYAAVHGQTWATENKQTAASASDIYNNAILPRVVTLDTSHLNYSVSWNSSNYVYTMTTSYETPIQNTVSVTVSYTWFPELYFFGPYTLSSTSTMPMMY